MFKFFCHKYVLMGATLLVTACGQSSMHHQGHFGSSTHHQSGVEQAKSIYISAAKGKLNISEKNLGSNSHHGAGHNAVVPILILGKSMPIDKENTLGSNSHHHQN